MDFHFFGFFSRMKNINRWALMRNTSNDSLSQHGHEVSALAHALAVLRNRRFGGSVNPERAALLGVYHDMPEILTGDMPTPVKYFNSEIKSAFKKVEAIAADRLLDALPGDLRPDFQPLFIKTEADAELWTLVKAADKLSALIKCIEERKAGNTEFQKAEAAVRESLRQMNLPEVECFMEEFLPSYELTLDQL
ncbi:MAG: 5'-deoxynucleotidase [Oscillospiraceae bacterium]|jgi:5'-deoxynucleotidase|nr:5'-deoxynucleotidase [Oscillospiraceae bacterium]